MYFQIGRYRKSLIVYLYQLFAQDVKRMSRKANFIGLFGGKVT